MKRFIKKIIVLFLSVTVFVITFCVYIDPYNVFHVFEIKDNGVEPNKNYIKTKYIIDNPNKFDAFVFGSSRVGYIHMEGITEFHAYNMTYSEATPKEIYDTLRIFVDNGVIPKKIFVGVDSLSYTIDPILHESQGLSAPYTMSKDDPLDFWKLYLDPAVCLEAYTNIIHKHNEDIYAATRFYDYGFNGDYGEYESLYDFSNEEASIGEDILIEETLDDIRNIVSLCEDNSIKCTFFTNPMRPITYEESINRGYYDFLRGLAKITEFCNFSGYNDITIDNHNWVDNSHYNAYVSDKVRECFAFHAYYEGLYEQGFGQWVNNDNIEEFIQLLKNQR